MTQKNKILIFGGAGFIGHHLVNLLQSKHDICVYDNFNIFGKISLITFMIIGRIELLSVIILLKKFLFKN